MDSNPLPLWEPRTKYAVGNRVETLMEDFLTQKLSRLDSFLTLKLKTLNEYFIALNLSILSPLGFYDLRVRKFSNLESFRALTLV